jgi:hypothetical protein
VPITNTETHRHVFAYIVHVLGAEILHKNQNQNACN